ncbi:hypothetical protein [Taklimakanibacter deserti]|uniref:hypothetical protein n=1 Tax=Taklimakanibacter deserti TaxID=2267839 RepID=UPI000E64CDC7
MATELGRHKKIKKRPSRATFTALDRVAVRDIGTMVCVDLDQDTDSFAHLIGKKVVIDGRMEHCFSVERIAHAAPWKRGERIYLLIRKARAKRTNHAGSIGPSGGIAGLWIDDA